MLPLTKLGNYTGNILVSGWDGQENSTYVIQLGNKSDRLDQGYLITSDFIEKQLPDLLSNVQDIEPEISEVYIEVSPDDKKPLEPQREEKIITDLGQSPSSFIPNTLLPDKLEGKEHQIHWGDMWHYAIARMVVAARANGLRPIDGPFGDFKDPDGFKAAAKRAAVLGCEGKWAIHPSQITLANEVMSPSESEILKANRILEAMADAEASGKGAVSLDGRLIDYASIKQAEVLVEKAKQIAGQ